MNNVFSPADIYVVYNSTIITEIDKKNLISLYEPIIGSLAVSLYLTLLADLDHQELISTTLTHHHLMTLLKSNKAEILKAREALEAVGLVKSYLKRNDNINEYLYELYSPISANEFFNHPVLSILLLNNIGEIEYKNLLNYYKKIIIKKDEFEEITSSMNNTFKSVSLNELDDLRRVNKLGINLEEVIDFDLLIDSIPKGLINNRTFNKKTKELINELAFIYNIDTLKMVELVRLTITDIGTIDKEELRKAVRRNYEFNHNGSLPTVVYRMQPEHLRSPKGDLSNRGKMIYVFENTKPYDFLKSKNKGNKPTSKELKILEHLAVDFNLPPGVINVLVDYTLRVKDGKLNEAYLETVANDWARRGIKTVSDAMDLLTKNRKKVNTNNVKDNKNVVKAPDWLYQEQKREEMSEEELQELEALFKEAGVN